MVFKLLKILLLITIISFIFCLSTNYGTVTYLLSDSKKYSSNTNLLNSLRLDNLSNEKKIMKIYTKIEQSLEHKFTYYSFFENPISVLFERLIFAPLYEIFARKKSQFFNTLKEPYLLINAKGGICHQNAIAIVKLAEEVGFKARTLWMEGHVVAEVYYNNAWHLFDANMDIIFKKNGCILSYQEIVAEPDLIYRTLEKKGWDKTKITNIANMYLSTNDNYFYHLYPFEKYVDIYYFLTRMFSYIIYLLMIFGILYYLFKNKIWRYRIN